MELFRAVCVHDPGLAASMAADALEDDAILILPPNFELLHHDQAHALSDLVQVGCPAQPARSLAVCWPASGLPACTGVSAGAAHACACACARVGSEPRFCGPGEAARAATLRVGQTGLSCPGRRTDRRAVEERHRGAHLWHAAAQRQAGLRHGAHLDAVQRGRLGGLRGQRARAHTQVGAQPLPSSDRCSCLMCTTAPL